MTKHLFQMILKESRQGVWANVGYWASPQHLVLEQPFIGNFSNV